MNAAGYEMIEDPPARLSNDSRASEGEHAGPASRDADAADNADGFVLPPGARFVTKPDFGPPRLAPVCAGRGVAHRDRGGFYFTLAYIVSFLALYFVFIAPPLWLLAHPLLALLPAYTGVQSIVTFCMAGLRDPGVLPRRPGPPNEAAALASPAAVEREEARHPPRNLCVRGRPVPSRYCVTCHLHRPPRCTHCRQCNVCVLGLDHHCDVVGTCLGRRNYAHFVAFTWWTCGNLLYCVLACAAVVALSVHAAMAHGDDFLHAVYRGVVAPYPRNTIPAFVIGSIAVLTAPAVFGLSAYHTYLVAVNMTTNEHLKKKARVYDEGLLMNCLLQVCPVIGFPRFVQPPDFMRSKYHTPSDDDLSVPPIEDV
mmetsp:Transcript_26006/g.65358  ORF Transcript_26006/g.65358 Transcript_26006/m.65358 type:complete len:368 (+) Transcript_26006:123-1226(+)|eukprot:CAMPEP_0177641390 /NCGR_PEP_ID=MMETSP0447-20121125/7039_1 /TAXON_ID=0 /ORGANISM="Stygamoeba regulata, Strain BSH-02190019" /LENGTH=367 /DNA_ID=CAMNT_0019143501 /DNA_START=283 /DNA_END=1386 /DNA_ORIENTATION=+